MAKLWAKDGRLCAINGRLRYAPTSDNCACGDSPVVPGIVCECSDGGLGGFSPVIRLGEWPDGAPDVIVICGFNEFTQEDICLEFDRREPRQFAPGDIPYVFDEWIDTCAECCAECGDIEPPPPPRPGCCNNRPPEHCVVAQGGATIGATINYQASWSPGITETGNAGIGGVREVDCLNIRGYTQNDESAGSFTRTIPNEPDVNGELNASASVRVSGGGCSISGQFPPATFPEQPGFTFNAFAILDESGQVIDGQLGWSAPGGGWIGRMSQGFPFTIQGSRGCPGNASYSLTANFSHSGVNVNLTASWQGGGFTRCKSTGLYLPSGLASGGAGGGCSGCGDASGLEAVE